MSPSCGAIASCLPLSFGLGHSFTDLRLGTDPRQKDLSTPRPIYETFWLNVYGPAMVQAIGRERLLSTPAALMEELPHGAVLWLTRPTPADFDSEEARLAQARALVHLRPELSLDSTLATLRQRSLEFTPVPMEFDPDVADILRIEADFQGVVGGKRSLVERFNRYHPPAVSEWLPASQAPAPDVDNVQAAIDTYEGLYAEQLVALFHTDVPQVMEGTLEALPRLDWRLWHMRAGPSACPTSSERPSSPPWGPSSAATWWTCSVAAGCRARSWKRPLSSSVTGPGCPSSGPAMPSRTRRLLWTSPALSSSAPLSAWLALTRTEAAATTGAATALASKKTSGLIWAASRPVPRACEAASDFNAVGWSSGYALASARTAGSWFVSTSTSCSTCSTGMPLKSSTALLL